MTHSGSEFEGFTQPLGSIAVGDGQQVLPAPVIPADYNPVVRGYETRVFSWQGVDALPIGVGEETGAIPVPQEVPASWILEITPDLGWPNKEALFQSYVGTDQAATNPLLKRFAGLTTDNLTGSTVPDSPADYQLQYTVPRTEFVKIVSPDYENYLWRVLSARDDGIESFPSVIQRFRAKVIVKDLSWTIDPVKLSGLTVTLGGKRTPDIKTIEIDGYTGNTALLGPNRWASEITVGETGQELLLRAIDFTDNTSVFKNVVLDIPSDDQDYNPVWNNFDEFGYLLDLDRVSGEDNTNYKRRLNDVYVHRSGPRYKGLINGTTRELDLTFDDLGLTLLPGNDTGSLLDVAGLHISIGSQYIKVDTDAYQQVREYHTLDTWDWSIRLNKDPIEDSIVIESPLGTEIDSVNTWTLDDDRVVFKDNSLAEMPIYASYRYLEKYDLTTGTVNDVTGWLGGLSKNGVTLFGPIQTGATIDTGSPGSYLALMPRTEVLRNTYLTFGNSVNTGLPVRWTDGSIRLLADPEFHESKLTEFNDHFGTAYDKWAAFLRSYIHVQWGFAIADRNVWGSKDRPLSGRTVLPTTYDLHLAHWQGTNPLHPRRYSSVEGYAYNYVVPTDGSDMQYHGIPSASVRSGIGYGSDLFVTVVSEEATQLVQAESEILATVSQIISDTVDTQGEPIVNSGDGALPGCGVLIV